MSDYKRFEHPALDDVYAQLDVIELAEAKLREVEAKLREAKTSLQERILELPTKIGDNKDLRNEIFHHFYWFDERVPALWLRQAISKKPVAHLRKGESRDNAIKSAYIEVECIECKQPFNITVTSRSDLHQWRGYIARASSNLALGRGSAWPITCDTCKARRDEASERQYAQQKAKEQARIAELRSMPYREYLQSPEWQERRRLAMKRAGFRCQVCNAYGVRLNVHHRTYERRGNEDNRDLITLCENCHATFHENGRLAVEA